MLYFHTFPSTGEETSCKVSTYTVSTYSLQPDDSVAGLKHLAYRYTIHIESRLMVD